MRALPEGPLPPAPTTEELVKWGRQTIKSSVMSAGSIATLWAHPGIQLEYIRNTLFAASGEDDFASGSDSEAQDEFTTTVEEHDEG